MQKLIIALAFICAFQVVMLAQNSEQTVIYDNFCPMVSFAEPPRAIMTGEKVWVVALVVFNSGEGDKIKFGWSVSQGQIVAGQGTTAALIQPSTESQGREITITFELLGLESKYCKKSISTMISVIPKPIGEPLDSYGKVKIGYEKAVLENLAAALQNNINSQGLVAISFDKTTNQTRINSRLKQIYNQLVNARNLQASRILFAVSQDEQEHTELWIVPPGAKLPELPENHRLIKAEDLQKAVLLQTKQPRQRTKKRVGARTARAVGL